VETTQQKNARARLRAERVLASGVVQSGMPAVVQGSGSTNNGNAAQDLWQLTPGTAGSLVRVTSRLQ